VKITGTNSYIILDYNGRKIKVEGEMIVGGFVAEKNTMKRYEPPFENELVTEEVKEKYIHEAIEKTKGSHMVIQFV
jgi:hypothetical protein